MPRLRKGAVGMPKRRKSVVGTTKSDETDTAAVMEAAEAPPPEPQMDNSQIVVLGPETGFAC